MSHSSIIEGRKTSDSPTCVKQDLPLHNVYVLSNTERITTSLLAGATAGAAAKTTIAPLDRTKINFQISQAPYSALCGVEISATMARIIPYAAIQFAAHEQWKRVIGIEGDKNKSSNPVKRLLAGSLAGVTSQSLTYPLDLARARMAVTHKEKYRTLREVFVKIWHEEGPRTFYRGYFPTILGVIPYAGVIYFMHSLVETLEHAKYTDSKKPGPLASLAFGATAGIFGQTSSYPLDIVRRRMQTSPRSSDQYKTVLGTLKKIYRTTSFIIIIVERLSMNWVKGPVAAGISFATYDTVSDILRRII
ncbi:hypothetical protein L9F63_000007, partial [Diploptera punctata]